MLEATQAARARRYLQNVISECCATPLLGKLVRASDIDTPLCLQLLLNMGAENGSRWLRTQLRELRMDVTRFELVAKLGLQLHECEGSTNATVMDGYKDICIRCSLWKCCFAGLLPYPDHFKSEASILVDRLVDSQRANLQLLERVCRDFGIDVLLYLPKLLKNTLLDWRPQLDKNGDASDGNASERKLVADCCAIVDQLKRQGGNDTILETVLAAWDTASYYRYEVFQCVLELVNRIAGAEANSLKSSAPLLAFLRSYRRRARAGQREADEWHKRYPYENEMDPISQWRLPFHRELLISTSTTDAWQLLRPETDLTTYGRWLEAAPLLSLDPNDVCTYAIKGALTTGALNANDNDDKWSLDERRPEVIKRIAECASHMTDLEMATAVLFQATRSCAGGADRCALADCCWQTCENWGAAGAPTSSVERVKRVWLVCHTEHALHRYGLADAAYVRLAHEPERLVTVLYRDHRLVSDRRPDVNAAVDLIVKVHRLDAMSLREQIVESFLQVSVFIFSYT